MGMCTQEQTKTAVREVLNEKDKDGLNPVEKAVNNVLFKVDPKDGHTVLGKIMDSHMEERDNKIISGITKRSLIPFVVLLFSIAGTWFALSSDVNQNTEFREAGNRFTQQDGLVLEEKINAIQQRQDSTDAWLTRIETKIDILIQKN